jgi:cysteine desulfurase
MTLYYLDHNASTPVLPEVLEEVQRLNRDYFGNASSLHSAGRAAKKKLEESREIVAQALGCSIQEILFTSGGSESDNLALRGVMGHGKSVDRRLIVSAFEHPAVLETALDLARNAVEVVQVFPNRQGFVTESGLEPLLQAKPTALVSILSAHNEIGTVQPLRALGECAHKHGALFHSDAVQSFGKGGPLRVHDLGVDLLSLSGHKIGGLKGAGVLYVKAGTPLQPQVTGGPQERQLRAGTENVVAIAAMAIACRVWQKSGEVWRGHLARIRDAFEAELVSRISGIQVNSDRSQGLPNTLHVTLPNCPSDLMVAALDMQGIAVSAGSACASGSVKRSQAMVAMGRTEEESRCVLRLSFGREMELEKIPLVAAIFAKTAENMQAISASI